MWAVAVVMAVSCIVLMFSSDFARYPTLQRMMSALGIFSALCLPFVLRRKAGSEDGGVGGIAAVIPVLFGCLWLITAYRIESENPVLWSCALEILAIVASTLSFYYVAAYFYGRAKPARGIVMLQAAVYLCMCTLMDNHSGAEKVLFGCLAAAFLVLEYVLLSNVKEKEEKESLDELKGDYNQITWGSQIRSYVFQPYTMVKDHRTGYEMGNIGEVMDGKLEGFVTSYLQKL